MSIGSPTVTPVVRALIIACVVMFGLQLFAGNLTLQYLALWPPGARPVQVGAHGLWRYPDFMPWQLLSYGLLHGGALHLLLNMFGLWMFGTPVERVLGARRFLLYFAVCVAGAGAAQIIAAAISGEIHPTIGASGGVFGLLPAFALFFPQARVQLLFPPVALRAPVFVLIFGAVEFFFGISDTLPAVAHFAHLGGMLIGMLLLAYWYVQIRRARRG